MKKIILFLTFLIGFIPLHAQTETQQKLADAYLEKYSGFAVEEMMRSGVPASITLAQGMLESNYGRSELAVKANNHFGIQCHGDAWKGKRYEHMDAGELRQFRKYKSVLESYEDHSNFLLKNKRYAFLFELERTDYKGWARGLKKAGYAEDPEYANKLIRVVEMFGLDAYDRMTQVPDADKKKVGKKEKKKDKKPEKAAEPVETPQVVVVVEQPEQLTERQRRSYRYTLSREMYSMNGVPFVYASRGETYSDIARQYDLFLREVLSFNDAEQDCELPSGTVVYLQAKKNKASKGNEQYAVEEGMDMKAISQKFAVKLKKLCKLNNVSEDYVPEVGAVIKLR